MLDSLSVARYDSSVAVVNFLPVGSYAVHPDDTLYLATYALAIKTLLLDGATKFNFATQSEPEYGALFASNIDVAQSESAYIYVAMDSAYADSSAGLIVVKVAVDTTLPGADLRLIGILTEDSVRTNVDRQGGRTYFDRLARRFMPDYNGRSFSIARFDTLYDTMRFVNSGFRPEKLSAAVLVMDASSHQVLQARELNRFPLKEGK